MQPFAIIHLTALGMMSVQPVYWAITERQADRAKPKQKAPSTATAAHKLVLNLFVLFMVLQLLSLVNVAAFTPTLIVELAGLALVTLSLCICVAGRRTLGTNWAHGAEFQIKSGHELVTSGIYAHIRHPIYIGLALGIVGVELVAHSYLAFILAPILAYLIYTQARREERLLISHFGQSYRDYMSHTAMFIPILW